MAGSRSKPKYGAGGGLDLDRLRAEVSVKEGSEFQVSDETLRDWGVLPPAVESDAEAVGRVLRMGGDPSLSKRHRRVLRRQEARRATNGD